MKAIAALLCCTFLLTAVSSCYRMPREDECSLVPMTNNPDVTRDRGPGLMPGVSY